MRFWFVIDRDNVWQRRMIAIGAGVGGGLIYLLGTMMLGVLQPTALSENDKEPEFEMRLRKADETKK